MQTKPEAFRPNLGLPTPFMRIKASYFRSFPSFIGPRISLQCVDNHVSPRFLTRERATHDPLPSVSTARAARATAACTTHTLHARLTRVIVPVEGKVVHEEHARRAVGDRLDLDAAQAAEVVREVDVLQLAVFRLRARRQLDLSVVRSDLIAELGIPGPACDVENAGPWAVIVTAEPGALGVEPEGGQAVVGAIGNLAKFSTCNVGGHTILVPSSVIGPVAIY